MSKIQTENIIIEVLETASVKHFFNLHILKIKVTALKNINFSPEKIFSTAGSIVFPGIEGIEILKSTKMKKNDEITGYIAIEKNSIATLRPELSYECKCMKIAKNIKKKVL
jgi:hypothetical protein